MLDNNSFSDELMIEDTMVMDRIHVLQQSLEELTITAKSRASSAGQVGWVNYNHLTVGVIIEYSWS